MLPAAHCFSHPCRSAAACDAGGIASTGATGDAVGRRRGTRPAHVPFCREHVPTVFVRYVVSLCVSMSFRDEVLSDFAILTSCLARNVPIPFAVATMDYDHAAHAAALSTYELTVRFEAALFHARFRLLSVCVCVCNAKTYSRIVFLHMTCFNSLLIIFHHSYLALVICFQ